MMKLSNPFKNKKFKHGGLSVLFTAMFVAAVIMVNIIAGMLLDRYNVKLDLTENRLYTIEDATTNYLKQLDDSVTITVMSRESDFSSSNIYYYQTNEIIKKFEAATSNVKVNYVDLMSNPAYSNEDTGYGSLEQSSVIVESATTGRHKVLNVSDYISAKYYDYNGDEISSDEYSVYSQYGMAYVDYGAAAESALVSAFLSVTDVSPVHVGVTEGFGESALPALYNLLEKNAYILRTVDMVTEDIDEEIDFLLITANTADYSEVALSKIDAWLDNGGKFGKTLIYVAPSNNIAESEKLDSFLYDWGIEVERNFVIQTDSKYVSPLSGFQYTIQHYESVDETYSSGLSASYRIYGEYMRHTKQLYEAKGNVETKPLLTSYEGGVLFYFDEIEGFDDDSDLDTDAREKGEWTIAVESKKSRYEELNEFSSRVIVFGGIYVFDDSFIQMSNANNAVFFMNMVNNISGKEVSLTLTAKSFSVSSFQIDAEKSGVIGVIFAVVLPVLIIITGVVIWLKRRYR